MKVLVVDDDVIAREALCSELEQGGCEVLSLPSPIGATRVIHDEKVDVIVLDVVMPRMRGDRLAKLLRGNPRFAKLTVVLVSGETGVALEELASAVGADAVVSKGHIRTTLLPTVKAAARARVESSTPSGSGAKPRAR
jgi:CheY-like chemotaxis protein